MAGKRKINFIGKTLILSLFHGLVLTVLCLFFIQQPYIFPDEDLLIKISGTFKNVVLQLDEKPDPEKYLFINTSYDNNLIDKIDLETGFPLGNQVITDRKKLAEFIGNLSALNNPHRYLLCDIFFESESPDDISLEESFSKLEKYRIPFHYGEESMEFPIIKAQIGLGDYQTVGGGFMKFNLIQHDSLKTIPLLMYEDVTGNKVDKTWYGSSINGKPMLNSFIVNLRLRDYDIKQNPPLYPLINLGDLMYLDTASLREMVEDKIILIGNYYDHDQHETLYGSMSGTLLLANVYHSLELGDPFLSVWFFIFLIIIFSGISFMVVWHQDPVEKIANIIFGKKAKRKALTEFPIYLALLCILSFISFFVFSIHLQVFLLNIYVSGINWLHK